MEPSLYNPADDEAEAREDGTDPRPTGDDAETATTAADTSAADGEVQPSRSEPSVETDQVASVDELMAQVARSAGIDVGAPAGAAGGPRDASVDDDALAPLVATSDATGSDRDDKNGDDKNGDDKNGDGHERARRGGFWRRHPKTSVALVVVVALLAYPSVTYVQALRKDGNESLSARTAEWARDMKLGFAVDWAEQRQYANDQFQQGGTPDPGVFAPVATSMPKPGSTTTKVTIPHTPPPMKMASPVDPPAPGEGDWSPIGPQPKGLPGVYITRVRPDTEHTSLTLFAAWIDPKLTQIRLFPGTDLPGGTWNTPHYITPDLCQNAIMASNGGFRLDQSNGGYYAEAREPKPLVDNAASLVFYKDGTVNVGQWGRDMSRSDLPQIDSVRQNLVLLVDGGQPAATVAQPKWGAQLPNSYFVWRSGYGVTKDGALVYVGGPALTPLGLAQALINAGAVRAMEGDINPEWVNAILYTSDGAGGCKGEKGLTATEDKGGMRGSSDRYLSTDTRDFVAVFAKP